MKERERERFGELYAEHAGRIYGFVAYRVPSAAAAEDLTQIVFEKALRAWARYDPERASEQSWLFAIARNALTDYFRQRREVFLEDEEPEAGAIAVHDEHDLGLSAELSQALERLRPRERTVIALRFGGELTGPEIGELLGLSTDNVHQILSRSLRRLREDLVAGAPEPAASET